ncbi:hypothetical protein JOB18_048090 [Solea senegalensis]|uniref:Uncharacterized protein n=1 Tax=Solea senegalensis TaxID=28829 RepID=A0AAV6R9M2_SOLSE|nr:hypothetical protein JOB18_048090 [Solea senegalensis]
MQRWILEGIIKGPGITIEDPREDDTKHTTTGGEMVTGAASIASASIAAAASSVLRSGTNNSVKIGGCEAAS